MGKIYTSYFAKASKFDENKFILASISNSSPITLPMLSVFVPDWKTIVGPHKTGKISDEEYMERYYHQLDSNLGSVKSILNHLLGFNKDIVLMCYESPEKFCHRHLLSNWVRVRFGYDIEEYKF